MTSQKGTAKFVVGLPNKFHGCKLKLPDATGLQKLPTS